MLTLTDDMLNNFRKSKPFIILAKLKRRQYKHFVAFDSKFENLHIRPIIKKKKKLQSKNKIETIKLNAS